MKQRIIRHVFYVRKVEQFDGIVLFHSENANEINRTLNEIINSEAKSKRNENKRLVKKPHHFSPETFGSVKLKGSKTRIMTQETTSCHSNISSEHNNPLKRKNKNSTINKTKKIKSAVLTISDDSDVCSPVINKIDLKTREKYVEELKEINENVAKDNTVQDNPSDSDAESVPDNVSNADEPRDELLVVAEDRNDLNKSLEASKKDEDSEDEENMDPFEDFNHQIYQKNDNGVKHLHDGVYIQRNVLAATAYNIRSGSILIRHLMEGVFKPEEIENCSLKGSNKKEILHPKAVKAITDYMKKVSKSKGWSILPPKEIDRVMTLKLSEIKKNMRLSARK